MYASTDSDAAAAGLGGVLFFLFLLFWIAPMLVGWAIGNRKGRGGAGFLWGLILGWIGVIVAACLQPSMQIQAQKNAQLAAMTNAMYNQYTRPSTPLPPPTPGTRR